MRRSETYVTATPIATRPGGVRRRSVFEVSGTRDALRRTARRIGVTRRDGIAKFEVEPITIQSPADDDRR